MKRTTFNSLKWLPLAAIAALAITISVNGSKATSFVPDTVANPDVDLANELRTFESFANDLYAYQLECAQLKKKASLLQTDIDPVSRKSDDLKRRLSDVQNGFRQVITKLKAANQWDSLSPSDGFRQALEDGSSNLSSHTGEVGLFVDNLRKKLATQTLRDGGHTTLPLVLATYRSPVKFVSVGCTVNVVVNGINNRLHRAFTQRQCVRTVCACGGNDPSTAGTGTSDTSVCSTSTSAAPNCPQP